MIQRTRLLADHGCNSPLPHNRLGVMAKLLCVLTLLAAYTSAQIVEGHVVNAATGAGIAGVDVDLVKAGKTAYSTMTDSQGRFRIEAVNDGVYTANYKVASFWPVPNRFGDSRPPFKITSGSEPVHLETKMQPIGKIAGRVLDAADKPVPNARLWLHWESSLCKVPLCIGFAHQSKTDEKGEYSVTNLEAPGTWTVSATAPSSWNSPEPLDDQRLGWAQTFYPGVTDPQLAARVTTGSELWLDIKLVAVPVHRIRGVVLDGRGRPVPKAAVTLGKGIDSPSLHQETKEDGAFAFESVPEDEWRLFARVGQNGVKLYAAQSVRVSGRDLDNIELRLSAPFSIQGKVVMDVPEGAPTPKPPMVMLALNDGGAPGDAPDGFLTALPDGKGDFTIQNLYPGPYQIVLPGALAAAGDLLPPSYYLESIRLGDRDSLGSDIQILSGFQNLTVTYKLGGGTVRGSVEGCAPGEIVLIPQDPGLRRSGFIRRTPCAQNGGFEISAVRPGEYYGLAISADGPAPAYAATFDDSLLSQATRVAVRANESASVEIRLIRP
jgi:uncharacterized GH25 family protein